MAGLFKHGNKPSHSCEQTIYLKFEVFMAVRVLMLVFWCVMLCGLEGFGHIASIFRAEFALKMETVYFSIMLVSTYKST
jgi:hypothetical protein